MAAKWFMDARVSCSPDALRLFCLPYAGGGAAVFRSWPRLLAPDVETLAVQLPGRGSRLMEKPYGSLRSLARDLAGAFEPLLDRPYALFGHSLGALVAFETARALRRRGAPLPSRLFLAALRGPRLKDPSGPLHHLPDDEFVEEVNRRYGAIPEEVRREADLMELLLPSLRADFEMLGTYEYERAPPLRCPIVALAGQDDDRVSPGEVAGWSDEAGATFTLEEVPGGHFFFLTESEAAVIALVRRELQAARESPGP